jgi:hypothetical protein
MTAIPLALFPLGITLLISLYLVIGETGVLGSLGLKVREVTSMKEISFGSTINKSSSL